jgi:hypothetical protein
MSFNPNQLSTMAQVDETVAQLDAAGIGGGVVLIYIPEWLGPFPEPSDGEARQYCLTYANGSTGHNVGLIRSTIEKNPSTWPQMLQADAIPPSE